MSGSCYGTIYKTMTWGESHGRAVGAVIDGCPSRVPLTERDIDLWLERRRPGRGRYSTKRDESDKAEILSGVFEGLTTGAPICVSVANNDARSGDYEGIRDIYRPSHADFTYGLKYGHRDYRGGGRASGRETIGRVISGAVAARILNEKGIRLTSYVRSIGEISIDMDSFNLSEALANPLNMPDREAAAKAAELLERLNKRGDSIGGVVECIIEGLPVGVGEPVFKKLDAEISKAVMSIGAVKGIEFGSGFEASRQRGSVNNDRFLAENGKIHKASNNAGGVLGGISDGSPVVFRAAFKPTPSISIPQDTVTKDGRNVEAAITGRHDPVIAPRGAVVVEAMAAVAILDLLLLDAARLFPRFSEATE